jgi:hypothetical protein
MSAQSDVKEVRTREECESKMAKYVDRSRFEEMNRSSLPLNQVAQFYYTACRTEGTTEKTMRGYEEKLSRFVRWFEGTVGKLTLERERGSASRRCGQPRNGAIRRASEGRCKGLASDGSQSRAYDEGLRLPRPVIELLIKDS